MTSPPPLTGRLTPPEFDYFADVVMRFVDAAESLLKAELSHPFNIGSEAMRDRAASDDHPGTWSKQTLLTLATQQGAVGLEQCDLLRGIAAILRTDLVTLAPFPLARTSAVIAAKAWYVLTAGSKEERLRRFFLNEELAALYGLPFPSGDEEAVAERDARAADYRAVGATAGLEATYRKKPRLWDAPILARAGRGVDDAPPSETQLVKDFYRASGLQEDELAGPPYSLLSAATHGRFRQAGLVRYASASPSVGGVSTAAMHVTLGVTAQTTMYAAIAMQTYLCALARYTAVSETVVLTRLHGSTEEWSAIAQQETEQPKRDAFPDAGRPTL
jgi:hypothetical protein